MREFAMKFLMSAPLLVLGAMLCVWPLVAFAQVLDRRFADAVVTMLAMGITAIGAFVYAYFTESPDAP